MTFSKSRKYKGINTDPKSFTNALPAAKIGQGSQKEGSNIVKHYIQIDKTKITLHMHDLSEIT